jgi:hypothetical protein
MKQVIILLIITAEIRLCLFSWNSGINAFLTLLFLAVLLLLPTEQKKGEPEVSRKTRFPKSKIPLFFAFLSAFLPDTTAQTSTTAICFILFFFFFSIATDKPRKKSVNLPIHEHPDVLLTTEMSKKKSVNVFYENPNGINQPKQLFSFSICSFTALIVAWFPAKLWFSGWNAQQIPGIPRFIVHLFSDSVGSRVYNEVVFRSMYLVCFSIIFFIFLTFREKILLKRKFNDTAEIDCEKSEEKRKRWESENWYFNGSLIFFLLLSMIAPPSNKVFFILFPYFLISTISCLL